MKKKINHKKQGKKNRAAGKRFETKVRKDLESNSWIVAKWTNTVEDGKLVPIKPKFNPFTKRIIMASGGIPDFIAFGYRKTCCIPYDKIIGVECKIAGYLDEKEKIICNWLIENAVFSEILIACRSKKRGEIEYKNFDKKIKEVE